MESPPANNFGYFNLPRPPIPGMYRSAKRAPRAPSGAQGVDFVDFVDGVDGVDFVDGGRGKGGVSFMRWMPAGFLHRLFLTHHSPLEGESARRGRSPKSRRWGERRKRQPRPAAWENRKDRLR